MALVKGGPKHLRSHVFGVLPPHSPNDESMDRPHMAVEYLPRLLGSSQDRTMISASVRRDVTPLFLR